jgi:hypothetical protein
MQRSICENAIKLARPEKPHDQKYTGTRRLILARVAYWKNGEIFEERLFYDLASMMKQIGLK